MAYPTRSLFLLFLASALPGAVGRAPAQEDEDDEGEPDAVVVMPQQPMFMAQDQNFDSGVFGTFRNALGARVHLDTLLTLQVDDVDRTCGLNEAQKKKLLLAGRGDVLRAFGRVDEKRRVFQVVKTDQMKFQQLYQELAPIQQSLQQGVFGDGSLFSKTLRTTLDEKQVARYQEVVRERQVYQYQARVDLAVANLDNAVGLDAAQRARLLKLVREETRPPRRFSPYDHTVVLLQLARLPEARLRTVFNEAQWGLLTSQLDNARRLEPFLNLNGYLPDDAGAKTEPAPAKPH